MQALAGKVTDSKNLKVQQAPSNRFLTRLLLIRLALTKQITKEMTKTMADNKVY